MDVTVLWASAITGGVALIASYLGVSSSRSLTKAKIEKEERDTLRTLRLEAIVAFNSLALELRDSVFSILLSLRNSNDPEQRAITRVMHLDRELTEALGRVILVCSESLMRELRSVYIPAESALRQRLLEAEMGAIDADELNESLTKFSFILGGLLASFRAEILDAPAG